MKKRGEAIKNAWNGIIWGIQTQPNYKIHIALSIIGLLAGITLEISYTEWLIIIVTMALGFVIETLNTAVEKIGDAVDLNYNEAIKHAKDSSAGAMLIFSAGAVIVACIIFLPKIIDLVL